MGQEGSSGRRLGAVVGGAAAAGLRSEGAGAVGLAGEGAVDGIAAARVHAAAAVR